MNKISSRQLYFFLAAVAPVGKLILLPVTLAHYAANDLLFPAAINFFLQAGVIALVLLLAKNGLSLGELLKIRRIVGCVTDFELCFRKKQAMLQGICGQFLSIQRIHTPNVSL